MIGPDEFHEHVDNNVFTNWMAQWNLNKAVELYGRLKETHPETLVKIAGQLDLRDGEVSRWQEVAGKIYIPFDREKKLIEQFAGYFRCKEAPITAWDENDMPVYPAGYDEFNAQETTLVKQPDVVMLMYVLPDEFDDEVKRLNYDFYEQRTMHKSSLSPAIHSIMGIEVGDTKRAVQYFLRSALVDLVDNQGNTEMGMHAASAGGTWMCVVFGFGGFRVKNQQMTFKPWLPADWEELRFQIKWRRDKLRVCIRENEALFYSQGETMAKRLSVVDMDRCVGCQSCMFACVRRLSQGGLEGTCLHIHSAGGIRKGFVVIVCRACPDPPCARVCPTDALLVRKGGGVTLKGDRCIGCENCVEACPFGAVFWDHGQNKPQICIYCGYCASYCPYDVLAVEKVEEVSYVA